MMKYPNFRVLFSSWLIAGGILLGTVFTTGLIANVGTTSGETWKFALMLLIPVAFLVLGFLGFRKWRRYKKKNPDVWVFAGTWFFSVVFIVCAGIGVPFIYKNLYPGMHLNAGLKSYVKEEYSAEGVAMPEDPHFAFYNLTKKTFVPPAEGSLLGTDDPDKVNVVVAYKSSVEDAGVWVNKYSKQELKSAYAQKVMLYFIRVEDWALIRTATASRLMKMGFKDEKGFVEVRSIYEVQKTVTAVLKGEELEE